MIDSAAVKVFPLMPAEDKLKSGVNDDSPEEKQPPTLAEILESVRIKATDYYAAPPNAILIVHDEKPIPFATLGNFTLILGKAKSKKTFLMIMVVAACLHDGIFQGTFKCELPLKKRRIIIIDTEQSKYHVWKRLNAIARLVGPIDLSIIEVYSFRQFTTNERVQLIEHLLLTENVDKNIGLCVIDGIRDCVSDINDPNEATMIQTKLMNWTDVANCHIITVLHQNKGDQNARGHVGTELQNKAEFVISVTVDKNDKNISIVETDFVRDSRPFTPFAFQIQECGTPEIMTDFTIESAGGSKSKKINPFDYPPDAHHRVLQTIFKNGSPATNDELLSAIQTAWMATSINIGGISEAKKIKSYYVQQGWIKNEATRGKKPDYKYIT